MSNSPYGMHSAAESGKSSSGLITGAGQNNFKKLRCDLDGKSGDSTHVARSTFEVNWNDVVEGFHLVKLPKKSSGSKNVLNVPTHNLQDRKIYNPVFRQMTDDDLIDLDEESDTEEDVSDSTVMHRHQKVLDTMRENLNKFTEERKKQQQMRKNLQHNK
jgi:hypothetical protein